MDLQTILSKYPPQPQYLIEMLIDVDDAKEHHYVSEDELRAIAAYVGVRDSQVYSVMSFYTMLSTVPRGKYVIQVCKDVPCYLNDDFNVLKTIEDELAIGVGDTTADQLFSLELTACIGCCDEAPAMRINHETYTNLSDEKVRSILESYRGGLL